jgi:cytochrome c biogenesis protein CcdA
MLALTLLVASIAIADSINPSTIVPGIWLAAAPRARVLMSFALGVFAIYLAGGLVLVFGPGPALIGALKHVGGPVEHALEAVGGVVALTFAVAVWRARNREPRERPPSRLHRSHMAFALGAGIMGLELPTAFIYFGAISAVLSAHRGAVSAVLLLLVYNTLFVLPLVAILGIRRVASERADRWLASSERWVRQAGQVILAGAAGAAGAVFVTLGVSGLVT